MNDEVFNNQKKEGSDFGAECRAIAYVRMSTENQEYSTDNQLQKIKSYALEHGYVIVNIYKDNGKSGLTAEGRPAFLAMIDNIKNNKVNFSKILVYDVSRWGRFQNSNEGAYHQFICEQSGVEIIFCAEPFRRENTPIADLERSIKRTMAAEYSRELSVKVFHGQANLIRKGYRQGGPAGYGLRRQLVDSNGTFKKILSRGEHKSIQTDRVILVPGSQEEIRIVELIYQLFVKQQLGEQAIANQLNNEGIKTDLEREWSRSTVHQILINEKYIGNNVWNRQSFKLKTKRIRNKPQEWVRVDNTFQSIVSLDLFNEAQSIIIARSYKLTNEEMLDKLRRLYDEKGRLSGIIIDEVENYPSSSAYQYRFGSLLRCYKLIGYQPNRDYSYIKTNKILREKYKWILNKGIEKIVGLGASVNRNQKNDLLIINEEFTVSLILSRCQRTKTGSKRWVIRLDTGLNPDITLVIRMSDESIDILDYYLFPALDLPDLSLRLLEHNPDHLEIYRFDTLEKFYAMTERVHFKELTYEKK